MDCPQPCSAWLPPPQGHKSPGAHCQGQTSGLAQPARAEARGVFELPVPSISLHAGSSCQHTEGRRLQRAAALLREESPPVQANHSRRTIYSSNLHLISLHKQIIVSMKLLIARNYAANISGYVSPANCLLPVLFPYSQSEI